MSGDAWTHAANQSCEEGCKNFRELQKERQGYVAARIKNGCPCRTIAGEVAACTMNKTGICKVDLANCPILFSSQISGISFQMKLW